MADLIAVVSIVSSIVSITLALFAIWFSTRVENRIKKNFLHLKKIMDDNHMRTKDVLANIDREAEAIKSTVYQSQTELQEKLEEIIEECNISGKHQEEK